ncbi:MAG TPA: aquaporin [Deinococcales bacterium]|nr:aquaporin [Deinococcales bacterium]
MIGKGFSLPQALVAEVLGTFALNFFGTAAVAVNAQTHALGSLGVPLSFGLAIGIAVTLFGPISGCHINPAATLALWVSRRFPSNLVAPYVVSQLVGGVLAALAVRALFGTQGGLGVTLPAGSEAQAVALEAVLTFWLLIVALRVSGPFAGVAVGGVLLVDAVMGGAITGASMNPARSFGPALVAGNWTAHWVYWVGPLLGGLAAAGVNAYLQERKPVESVLEEAHPEGTNAQRR